MQKQIKKPRRITSMPRWLPILAASLMLCVACWATWNIYGIAFDRISCGIPLKALADKTASALPDFMAAIGYRYIAYKSTIALSLGMYILALCGICLGILSRNNVHVLTPILSPSSLPRRFGVVIRLVASAGGWLCVVVLLMRAAAGRGGVGGILLWLAASLFFWIAIADGPIHQPRSLLSGTEWFLLCLGMVIAAAFYMWHATWWLYACIGDEYGFLGATLHVASGQASDSPFAQIGMCGFPSMILFANAGVMKIFGENNFGWRANSALFGAPG